MKKVIKFVFLTAPNGQSEKRIDFSIKFFAEREENAGAKLKKINDQTADEKDVG